MNNLKLKECVNHNCRNTFYVSPESLPLPLQCNECTKGLVYLAFYAGKKEAIRAESLYAAKLKAIQLFNVPKSKQGLLAVELAERDGEPVVHTPDF